MWESNPRMLDPQTSVLTTSPIPPYMLTGIVGIEPTPTVLETVVLPLNYIPIMEESGFEPPNSERAVLQTAAFSHFAIPPDKMARDGIEPPTHGASIHCSTN